MTEVSIPNGVFINWTDTYSQYKPLSPEIIEILAKHLVWVTGLHGGKRAALSYADLTNADLRNANLRGADLTGSILTDANMDGWHR